MTLTLSEPSEWWVEIPPEVQEQAWQISQNCTQPSSQWNAYLNFICLEVLLPWIRNEYALNAEAWLTSEEYSSIWNFVNGTVIETDAARLVLIPAEAIDKSELEVPQEWVDIPNWLGDYYLATQIRVNEQSEDQWIRVWGYTSHQLLKREGCYDSLDRTYSIDNHKLTKNLNNLWLTLELCPEVQTREPVAQLLSLSSAQAERLIYQLSSPDITFPRLSVPFEEWSGLLVNDNLRHRLFEQRQAKVRAQVSSSSLIGNLSRWLQGEVEAGWQSIESLFENSSNSLALSFRSSVETDKVTISQAKLVSLDTFSENHVVLLLVHVTTELDGRLGISIQLHPTSEDVYIPSNIRLSLLSDAGELLQSVQAQSQDNFIQLRRFKCSPGTCFSVEIAVSEQRIIENFTA